MDQETKAKVKELEDKGWMSISFIFEVLGANKEIVEKSLKQHIEKLDKIKTYFAYKKKFSEIEEQEKPLKNIEKGYSQFVEIECMIKDLTSLFVIAISYGPSSVEINKPKKMDLTAGQLQDLVNLVAGTIHKIAEAGLGGVVATPRQ